MQGVETPCNYRILDTDTVPAFIGAVPKIRSVLGERTDSWRVREVGDGNLNLVHM